ncbi:MAG: putative AAA-ATPase [bacterium ADurb.Bin243]|nr:MAG: putative AAA-ATPase [bacterium ADurb.Bin243]
MPIQAGYVNGYYGEIIEFMRNLLSGALKGNNYLEKSVLTGILRVAKESIFSGLNNLKVSTLLDERYAEYFGFTEEEVEAMAEAFKNAPPLNEDNNRSGELKTWYNGYIFGKTVIYNPWSIINYFDNPGAGARPYWINTSSNDIIKDLLKRAGAGITKDVQTLIAGGVIEKVIDENIVYGEIDKSAESLWSFFLMSGYLKAAGSRTDENGLKICELMIPNREVLSFYRRSISGWFEERGLEDNKHRKMLECLAAGAIPRFEKYLQEVVLSCFSYFDITESAAEKVYHAFIMGLMIGVERTHAVRSNRESGYGRYDLMLAPKSKDGFGLIFEFKKVDAFAGETLETACDEALKQIETKEYKTELRAAGVNKIIEIALAFEGKKVMMKHRAAE